MPNALYYGDNLQVLRDHIPDESVDLIYLDPPFNSNASYNVLFRERTGEESPAQIKAFTDTWKWTQETESAFHDEIILKSTTPSAVKDMITAFREFIGSNALMAYIVMMTPRLVELHRVLKPTGSIYLHCDPTASHYLKIVMDTVFGKDKFRNEIVWRRTNAHNNSRVYGRIHDILLFYTKTNDYYFAPQIRPYLKGYVDGTFRHQDSNGMYRHGDPTGPEVRTGESGQPWQGYNPTAAGRHWAIPAYLREELERREGSISGLTPQEKLDLALRHDLIYLPEVAGGQPAIKRYLTDRDGTRLQDLWAYQPFTEGILWESHESIDEDVKWVQTGERLGYQTQKPEGLLNRIISTSCPVDGTVLDPFCGCGTAVAVAEKLDCQWIGIDITHLAVTLMKNRLKTMFDIVPGADYVVIGEPTDVGGARALAEQDRFQFQYWATSLLEAYPQEEGKRGADRGIDGLVYFIDGPRRKAQKAIIQVKSGGVKSGDIRDLKGVVEREKAALGLFITLEEPTSEMNFEAVTSGFYHSDIWDKDFPKLQIRTIEQLLAGDQFEIPARPPMYQAAQRVRQPEGEQGKLEDALGA